MNFRGSGNIVARGFQGLRIDIIGAGRAIAGIESMTSLAGDTIIRVTAVLLERICGRGIDAILRIAAAVWIMALQTKPDFASTRWRK